MAGRMLALTSSEAITLKLVLQILLQGKPPRLGAGEVTNLEAILDQFEDSDYWAQKTGDRPLDA